MQNPCYLGIPNEGDSIKFGKISSPEILKVNTVLFHYMSPVGALDRNFWKEQLGCMVIPGFGNIREEELFGRAISDLAQSRGISSDANGGEKEVVLWRQPFTSQQGTTWGGNLMRLLNVNRLTGNILGFMIHTTETPFNIPKDTTDSPHAAESQNNEIMRVRWGYHLFVGIGHKVGVYAVARMVGTAVFRHGVAASKSANKILADCHVYGSDCVVNNSNNRANNSIIRADGSQEQIPYRVGNGC